MTPRHLAYHGLAIKRLANAQAVAELTGLGEATVAAELAAAVATGRAIEARDGYTLTPLARIALEASYGGLYGGVRADAGIRAAYDRFETINRTLKQVVTDWQTMEVRGERVANDHSDDAYDAKIIDRLGDVHERIEPVLATLARTVPRIGIYARKLGAALERAEDGAIEWVSDIRRESYHTVWFELHEDLLRIMGTVRDE